MMEDIRVLRGSIFHVRSQSRSLRLLLAQVDYRDFMLIDLHTGNRWTNKKTPSEDLVTVSLQAILKDNFFLLEGPFTLMGVSYRDEVIWTIPVKEAEGC